MKNLKKRIIAIACVAMMGISMLSVSNPTTVEAKTVNTLAELSRQAAAEGCVLVKNENNVLPLADGTKVAVFGRAQCNYVACGEGSGGGVNTNYRITILDGLEQSGKLQINSDLKTKYKDFADKNKDSDDTFGKNAWKDYAGGDNANNKSNKAASWVEMEMSEDEIRDVKNDSDVAIFIIGRTSGEDRDMSFNKGSLLLTDKEETMLNRVSDIFDKVIVVLNTTGIIDMSWVVKYPKIDSVLYAWTGGQEGGNGVADIITGKVNPSGKLTDTIAKNVEDYPTYNNYGVQQLYYKEDIYVGYRYFETFAPDKVAYPFGFGLSYTTFDIGFQRAEEEDGYLKTVVSVTNTGDVAGKEVVQVYYGAPQGGLGNPVKELAAFTKTRELEPGETETLSLNFKISDMASYDDGGMYQESAYVLEAGEYKIYVGNSVRDSKYVHSYIQDKWQVVEQLQEAAAPIRDFERIKAVESGGTITLGTENVPKLKTNIEQRLNDNMPDEFTPKQNDDNLYSLKDVYDGKLTLEQFVAQMTPEQMGMLAQGSQDVKDSVTAGGASQFGGVRCKDKDGNLTYLSDLYGIPVALTADGPSGVKIKDKCTMIPCGNVLGCTWNLELMADMYELLGEELVLNEVDTLLGPGINIRRDPRCGRNFEYFSEDPLLSGRLAAVMVKSVQKTGATLTAKHFACNNCECSVENLGSIRGTADAIVSERALREIYLKVFEIYVKEGHARSIMTAYNPINGCWAASNYDLNSTILRDEWGFDGIVMSDWWANMSYKPWATGTSAADMRFSPDERGTMIKAQNDIWMTLDNPVSYNDEGKQQHRNMIERILQNYKDGYLKLAELQRSAYNICNYLLKSQAFSRKHGTDFNKDVAEKFYSEGAEWFTVEQAKLGNPQIEKITVGGRKLNTFNENVTQYKVYFPADNNDFPIVEVTPVEGTTVSIEQATGSNRTAVISATEGQVTIDYKIIFTDEDGMNPVLENPVFASLSDIKVNGESIIRFDSDTYEYVVAVDSLDSEPEVIGLAPEGITVKKTYDETTKTVILRAISSDQAVSYKVCFGIAPQSDEFDRAELNKFWTIEEENNANWELADGHLTIGAEFGSIWQGQDHLKNRFIQSAFGDWESVTKIDIPKLPSLYYQSFGVIAMEDDNNYVFVKMEYCSDSKVIIALCQEKDGSIKEIHRLSDEETASFTNTMYVKLIKLGNTYMAAVSPDGENYIQFTESVEGQYENPKFMLVNGNGDKELEEVLKAQFDYVRFNREVGDVVTIGKDTKLKVAEVTPIVRTAALKTEICEDTDGGLDFAGFVAGEELAYKINVEKTGYYDVIARVASPHDGLEQFRVSAYIDNAPTGQIFSRGTGGSQNWEDMLIGDNVKLTAGEHVLKVLTDNSGFDITFSMNYLQFKMTQEINNSGLVDAIEAAKAIDMSSYSEEERIAFAEAIREAEEALETAETAEEIAEAIATLEEAEKALISSALESAKETLIQSVEQASVIYTAGQSDYTTESWKAFESAYKEANKVLNNAYATADDVIKCNTALTEAKNALEKNDENNTPTSPDDGDNTPTSPDDGDNTPTSPDDGDNTPTSPDDGDNTPTSPDDGDNTPISPDDGDNTPTSPDDGDNTPTSPDDGDNTPTTPDNGDNNHTTPEDGNTNQITSGDENGNQTISDNRNKGDSSSNTMSIEDATKSITASKSDKDIAGSQYADLSLRVTKVTKNAVKLNWKKVSGAEGYIIFANKCGKKLTKVKEVSGNKTSWQQKKLKKGTYYKYVVTAYKTINGKKVNLSTSKTIHVPTAGGKYTDIKSLKTNKSKITLTVYGSTKLKVTEKKKDSKKKIKRHRKIRYESTNTKVATVSSAGKITAKAKGKCYVYAYAQNGVYKKITVTVK